MPTTTHKLALGSKNAVATIAVKDLEKARKFYEEKLGLRIADTEAEEVAIYQTGDSRLMVYASRFAGTNQATGVTWIVGDDLEDQVEALRERGVRFEHYDMPETTRQGDIHQSGEIRMAWFKDPDGNIISLVNGH